jgi:hypothetical protein
VLEGLIRDMDRYCGAQVTVLHGPSPRLEAGAWSAQGCPFSVWKPAVPFKHHAARRHHIPKPRYRVRNWREYDAAL